MPEDILRFLIEHKKSSSLKPHDYWRAVVRIAGNDAVLSASLEKSHYTSHKSNVSKPSLPIEVDLEASK